MQEIQKKRSRGSRLPGSVLRTAAVIVVLALFTSVAASEPAEEPLSQSHTHTEHERNEIGVFLGVTTGGEKEGGGKEDATATIGIGYRRNVSRKVGVEFLLEFSGGERRDHVGIVPVNFMVGSGAQLIVGAGWERHEETEFLWRLGFGYSIVLVPGNTIRPEINVDFVDGEVLVVLGASIGWGF
ncbi:MAG: hypothetical protein O7F11_00500 [Acidobacteria bacterium]|nr:hypothetical protein [Acidobacteriota bacterium]